MAQNSRLCHSLSMTDCHHDIPFLDPASPEFSTRSEKVKHARARHWCARTPYGLAVLRHREVGLLLRDKRLRQGSHNWPDTNGLSGGFADFWKRSIIGQEGVLHTRLRRAAIAALAPDFVESLVPKFDELSAQLASNLAATDRCEFMQDFARPYAGQAICVLLGLTPQEWKRVCYDASDLGLAMGVECRQHQGTFNAAYERLDTLAEELIQSSRQSGRRTSFVERLVFYFDESGLNDPQMLRDLVVISIFGGVDTTKSQLGFIMNQFCQHPEQWQWLRENPDLIGNTIEESIRAQPTTTWATREAVEDFQFGGRWIERGEILHMMVHASARDPAICEHPDFDISAKRKVHFGFGGGSHHCIGHLVARTDMACALRALSAKLVSFSFDAAPQFLPDSGNTSPVTLPLRLVVS